MADGLHELTAAYALDALDDHETREYEEHLRRCEQCRTAEARVALTWQIRCTTLVRRLCEPCARTINLSVPFTLTPLPSPPATR